MQYAKDDTATLNLGGIGGHTAATEGVDEVGESAFVRALRQLFKGGQTVDVVDLRNAFGRLPDDKKAVVRKREAEIAAQDVANAGEFELCRMKLPVHLKEAVVLAVIATVLLPVILL